MRAQKVILPLALAVGLAVAPPVQSQAKSVAELSYPPLPSFDVPEPTRVELDNGMVVLLLEDHELPLVEAIARIHTGSRLEPANEKGLAELTGEVLRTGGTTSMTGDELDELLESKAAQVETSIGTTSGTASMSSLAEDFPEVLRVFADVLRNPVFAQEKLEIAKTGVEAGIARQNDNPQQILFRELSDLVYGEDSPYAYEPTYESVANVSRDDLVAWHQKYFHPNRIVLGLVGDFDTEQTVALVREAFGDWPAGPEVEPPDVPYDRTPRPGVFFAEKNDITQSNIAMGHLGVRRDNPDYFALEVMNQIFGGGFASRLFSKVRSDLGLAYAVFGSVGSNWDYEGVTTVFTTTKTETTGAAIEALLAETKKMATDPPTEEEVRKARQAILSSFVFNFDSPREILEQQLTYEYFGYPLDWLERYRQGIEQVTPADVARVAEEYLHPERFSILVVGPAEGRDKPLSAFGQVHQLDISIPEPAEARAEVTEEGRQRGRELLARAVDALGGPQAVDALETFFVSGVAVQRTPQGEMEVQVSTHYAFPDRFRQELTLPMGSISMTVSPAASFMVSPQGAVELPGSQKELLIGQFRRSPLALLQARDEPGFEAVALGPEVVNGQELELVQIEHAGLLTSVGIDPETGRLMLVRYRGPGPGGAPGVIDQLYSDFREVEGLAVYPFLIKTMFEGEESASFQIEEIEANPDLEPALFERPPEL